MGWMLDGALGAVGIFWWACGAAALTTVARRPMVQALPEAGARTAVMGLAWALMGLSALVATIALARMCARCLRRRRVHGGEEGAAAAASAHITIVPGLAAPTASAKPQQQQQQHLSPGQAAAEYSYQGSASTPYWITTTSGPRSR